VKRAILALLVAGMAGVAAWSQPKIAVLDAMIPQNMDPSVIVPATEKIIERLVVSGRFTVLDRANIESVLKEREFQVSGMVSDQDVVTAGKYLGADFVVVAKISKVGDTYFISAKMIAIKTGVIANQTSAEGEGKLSVLIDLAAQVGEVLSGGAVLAQSAAGGSKDISKPTAVAPPAADANSIAKTVAPPVPSQPKEREKLKSRIVGSVGGTSGDISNSSWTSSITGAGDGFDLRAFFPMFKGLSAVANVDSVNFVNGAWTNSFIDLMAGLGYAIKLGAFVPYADIKGGISLGSDSSTSSTYTWSGMGGGLGWDLGFDLDLGRWLVLGMRYQGVSASMAFEDVSGSTVDLSSFFLSVGFRF
jgi:hypothetical protein